MNIRAGRIECFRPSGRIWSLLNAGRTTIQITFSRRRHHRRNELLRLPTCEWQGNVTRCGSVGRQWAGSKLGRNRRNDNVSNCCNGKLKPNNHEVREHSPPWFKQGQPFYVMKLGSYSSFSALSDTQRWDQIHLHEEGSFSKNLTARLFTELCRLFLRKPIIHCFFFSEKPTTGSPPIQLNPVHFISASDQF
jgi:hypothetical protein